MKYLFGFLFPIFFLFPLPQIMAQDTGEIITAEDYGYEEDEYDRENSDTLSQHSYTRAYMDESRLQSLRSKKEFKYRDLENDSLNFRRETVSASPAFKGIDVSIFLWLLVVIGVVIIILQLSGVNMRQIWSSSARLKDKSDGITLSENIHEIQYENAIRDALASNNFPFATRLLYLQSLKMLSDRNAISWHVNKTNWQYVYEIKQANLRSSFREVTSIFEYVHYGRMNINEEKFVFILQSFDNLKKQLE